MVDKIYEPPNTSPTPQPAGVWIGGRPEESTPPGTIPGTAPDPTNPNYQLYQQIAGYLNDMGLGSLFSTGADGTPGGWLWNQITSGIDDQAAIMLSLEDTEPFKTRYGIIGELRKQAAAGAAVHVPTVAEVREYEQTTRNILQAAGLPTSFYDSYGDLQGLMRLGLSPSEIEARVGQSLERVRNTDPNVRQAFDQFFGASSDGALASMYLDPSHTLAQLDRMSRTAYTAGMGQRLGVNIDQATADRIAASPSTDAGIYQDLGTVAGLNSSGIFTESLGEANDLNTGTAIDATFFGSGRAQQDIERRRLERNANALANPGGAVRTSRGLIGAGTANT